MTGKPRLEKLIIDVKINNLDRAVEFYRDILELPLLRKDSDWASFEASGAEIHLYSRGGVRQGLEFYVSAIDQEVELLKKRGVKFFISDDQINLQKISGEVMEFTWGKAAYFKDSEGNHIVLVQK